MEGIQLHVTERGAGAPLILLHGNGEDGSYFTHQLDAFSAHYRVLAVDTRGHGRSPRGTAPFTLGQFACDLEALMDAKHIKKASVLGFSDGGNAALLFTLSHPERVEKLILNGANLSPSGVKLAVQIPVVLGYGLAALISPFSPKMRAKKELLGLMVNEPHIDPASLQKLTVPVLVIAGTNDMIRTAHTRAIAGAIPNAELAILRGSHFIAAENSTAFNECVLKFLLRSNAQAQA